MKIIAYFDGACTLGEKAGYGFIITDRAGGILKQGWGRVNCPPEEATNNVAEHYALYKVLTWLLENGYKNEEITVYGDSNFVINQIFGRWKLKNKKAPYAPYAVENGKLVQLFSNIKGEHVYRQFNGYADHLAARGIRSEIEDPPLERRKLKMKKNLRLVKMKKHTQPTLSL